jgi:DinB superfamily
MSETGLPFRCVKRWFDRDFVFGVPVSESPGLLDRLSLTPQRVEAILAEVPAHVRVHQPEGRWSIQEHAGHLFDLEALWDRRLDDFDRGAPVLQAADLANRRTHEARHNDRPPGDLVATFRTARMAIHARLSKMSSRDLARVSRHPRLDQPMSVVDLCYFVAEHDDHHLAAMRDIAASIGTWPECAVKLLAAVDVARPWLLELNDERTAERPGVGKWSPREIVGHLIDSASNNHQRFVRGRWQEDLVFQGYDQDAWVAAQGYQDTPWPELVALWAAYNRHLARVMASVPTGVRRTPRVRHNFDRIAYRPVPADQPSTLEYFMDDYVLHLEHHLRQIRELSRPGSEGREN